MLNWVWPLVFLLMPLPLVTRWLLTPRELVLSAIRVPFYDLLRRLQGEHTRALTNSLWQGLICWLIWLCLLAAVAQPTWVGDAISIPQERRDMLLAVDISGSMRETDMRVDQQYVERLQAVKAVVGEFVTRRGGDRLGLILFGEQAYLQTPLTYDRKTVNQQLKEAQIGFAGTATAIGDTIGLAIKRLRDRPADNRVLILLTDGANSAGAEPSQATRIAAEAGIRIHTIGVGAEVKYSRDVFGRAQQSNPSHDLDEATLQMIATQTGGQYFRARDPKQLQEIYAVLDELEPTSEEQSFRPTRSLSHWPIALALILAGLLLTSKHVGTSRNTNPAI